MKLKNLYLIAGAIALSLSATPFVVNAQQISQTPTEVKPDRNGPFERLGLTDSQKTQIKDIRRNSRTQMEAILSPEQKQQLEAVKQQRHGQPRQQRGQRPGKNFASLNLTPEQKTKMREIRESEKNQIQAILTPEQQQKFKEFQDNMRSRHHRLNSSN